jgi:diaminopimelate decarboxylase
MTEDFPYRNGWLHGEGVPLAAIAAAVGTPFYAYSAAGLVRRYRAFAEALSGIDALICYALKANGNQAVIATFAAEGAGADVVSEGELRRALAAGVPADKIVFAGVGKTEAEMAFALDAGIRQFNVESEPELEALSRVAVRLGKTASLTVRVNPDVDAGTHAKITTGTKENKFGVDIDLAPAVYRLAARLPGVRAIGISLHIGSQLTRLDPYRDAFDRVAALTQRLRADGNTISVLDLGGGLGVRYDMETPPSIADYAALVKSVAARTGCRMIVEPGRALVAEAGVLVSRVVYVKRGTSKTFVILDAAMNDLIRPALYDSHHAIVPLKQPAADGPVDAVDVVGPICESSDFLAKNRILPPVAAGDLVAIKSAGAYAAVMSSTYNARLLAPEILIRGNEWSVVRPRQDYEQLIGMDRLPQWLAARPRGAA